MTLRRLRAIARKEFLHILRDPRSLIMALALPVFLLLLFGWALTLDVDRVPMLIMDSEGSPLSRRLIAGIEGSRYFRVVGQARDYRFIENEIDRGRCLMALVIPYDFTRRIENSEEVDVQILLDGTDSNTASLALSYADSVLRNFSAELQQEFFNRKTGRFLTPNIQPETRIWYNSRLESKNYIVPGLVAVILMIIAALLTSLTIAREWEMGTMEQLLSTPVRPAELVLGKMSAYFALGAVDTTVAIGLGVTLFEVPLRGSILFLAVSCFVFLFGALCWGILLSALASSQLLAYQLGMITSFLPAFLLSGFVFAIENMPFLIQIPTHIVPARYFISILREIFLKGAGLQALALELILLILYSTAVFLAATRKLKGKVA